MTLRAIWQFTDCPSVNCILPENTFYILFVILYRIYGFKVILYSYLILKKMNEHITDS